jgi:hypothetical protein
MCQWTLIAPLKVRFVWSIVLIPDCAHVYIDADGVIYDATLNQTDVMKNVYSKSANYCFLSQVRNRGLLLFCNAQLGNPMYERLDSKFEAPEKCLAGVTQPRLYNVNGSRVTYQRTIADGAHDC